MEEIVDFIVQEFEDTTTEDKLFKYDVGEADTS